jgi:hypothetical protein
VTPRPDSKTDMYHPVLLRYRFFFTVALDGGTLWHLQKFLQYVKYIILEFILRYRFKSACSHLRTPNSMITLIQAC